MSRKSARHLFQEISWKGRGFLKDHCIFSPHLLLLTHKVRLLIRKITNFTTLWWISPGLAGSAHSGTLTPSTQQEDKEGWKILGVEIDRKVIYQLPSQVEKAWLGED